MSEQIIIKLKKCTIVLYENEILQLPPDLIAKSINRGKGYRRAMKSREYQAKNFDSWQLYECLKGNRCIDDTIIKFIEHMDERELRNGILDYLSAKNKTGY